MSALPAGAAPARQSSGAASTDRERREAGQLPVLTTIRQVHRLSADEARRAYPVHVRGVVTYFGRAGWNLVVQDASDGIYVSAPAQPQQLHAGQLIEVEGFSGPGDFAPVIARPTFRVLGEQPMPEPLRMSMQQLFTGAADSQWVAVRGHRLLGLECER